MAAAFGHFASQERQCSRGLVEEIIRRLDDEPVRVGGPLRGDPLIDRRRFRKRLDVLAEEQANELEHGSLARSRTASEDDAAWDVAFVAVAGFHAVGVIVIVLTGRLARGPRRAYRRKS